MSNFQCHDSIVQRSIKEAKDVEICGYIMQPIWKRLRLFFRIIVYANQLSLYGAMTEICEEYESFHERTGRPVVMGQSNSSLVLSAIKTEVLSDSHDPAYQNVALQQYEERIERLSQQDKVIKFCTDAGFLSVVENGQYFMTKDTGRKFYAMTCREYTLPRDDGSSQPDPGKHKNWTRAGSYDQLLAW